MSTRSHTASVALPASPEAVFAALHTPSAIRRWWQAARAIVIPEPGGVWMAAWGADEDDPDYVTAARLAVFEPPRRLTLADYTYRSRQGGPPFAADFRVEFEIEPTAGGATLRVTQHGFPAEASADAFYQACERGWRDTLASVKRFFTT